MTTTAITPAPLEPIRPDIDKKESNISYWTLGAHALTFLLGVVIAFIAQNLLRAETVTFSTTSLISFLFGIALSAASTILAIAAISLGKASERVMIERSDASIRLQNEVFLKTTEALARIESSTGVTEKRIEDIISGRAGELSHAIAQRLEEQDTGGTKNRTLLESEIRASLMEELSSSSRTQQLEQRKEKKKQLEDANFKYRTFQNDLLVAIANSGIARSEKMGNGNFGAEGDELFDGVFSVSGQRIGVSVFATMPPLMQSHIKYFRTFLLTAAKEIQDRRFQHIIVAFDGEVDANTEYRAIFSEVSELLKTEVVERFTLIDGAGQKAIEKTVEYLRSLPTPPSETLKLASSS